jgi:cell shape-determining protein MreD
MRTAAHVLAAYVIILLLGAIWRTLGVLAEAKPEIAAVTAAYLGLTARRSLAGAVAGSIVIGYLADLLNGVPVGLYALVSGVVCILAHLVHRRILVRGWSVTLGFSFFCGAAAALLVLIVRLVTLQTLASPWTELWWIVGSGLATAVVGPLLLRGFRRIDATFARTHREKDAALEGLVG